MTKEQEDKIIAQAQDILERRIAVEMDIKVNLQNIVQYGAYLQGALESTIKVIEDYISRAWTGENKVYRNAELTLITSSKRNMQLYLDGTIIAYRNHKSNKKGKLESCDAYFVEYRNVITEVK